LVRKNPSGSEQTKLYCDSGAGRIAVDTTRAGQQRVKDVFQGPFIFRSDKITTIDVYVDRSLIEAYFDSYRALSARAYPTYRDATGIELFTEGGNIAIPRIEVYTMNSIFK
jgi:hypothetical protein